MPRYAPSPAITIARMNCHRFSLRIRGGMYGGDAGDGCVDVCDGRSLVDVQTIQIAAPSSAIIIACQPDRLPLNPASSASSAAGIVNGHARAPGGCASGGGGDIIVNTPRSSASAAMLVENTTPTPISEWPSSVARIAVHAIG